MQKETISRIQMRPAIAMIELIFAIVVIGFTLLSAPIIMQTSIRSTDVGMQQESIAAAASEIGLILTRHWDERDSNGTTGYGILTTSNGDGELDPSSRDLSIGSRKFNTTPGFTAATPKANFGIDNGDAIIRDDIDDFDGLEQSISVYAGEVAALTNNEGDYLDTAIYLTTDVEYGTDTATYSNTPLAFNNPFTTDPGTTNIKLVRVVLQSRSAAAEHNKSIALSAFSCNIGTPTPNVVPMN